MEFNSEYCNDYYYKYVTFINTKYCDVAIEGIPRGTGFF